MKSLSFEVVMGSDETFLSGLDLDNMSQSPAYEPGILYTLFDLPSNVGAFGFRIFGSCLDDSKCWCQVSEHTCSRDDGVSLGIESCHLTVLSVIASGVHHAMQCRLQSMLNFSPHRQVLLCVCMQTCLRTCILLGF